jgi:hypothetical protein
MPGADWLAPQRGVSRSGTAVTFVEEHGGRSQTFDFALPALAPTLTRWLAEALAGHVGSARSPVKRATSVQGYFSLMRLFGAYLAGLTRSPRTPQTITAAHVRGFLLPYASTTSGFEYRKILRTVLGRDPQLSAQARAVLHDRGGERVPAQPVEAYDDTEWQQIMTALRHTVNTARRRITASRDLVARHRAGELRWRTPEGRLGRLLDHLDRFGSLPTYASGDATTPVQDAGGVGALHDRLSLTGQEAAAFCLLLAALTGENFGTVGAWPAAHSRPSGETDTVVLIEAVKPRRGPEREHMVTAVEDVPRIVEDLLCLPEDQRPLFRSPARLYLLLLDLTAMARRHGGHHSAFACHARSTARGGVRWRPRFGGKDLQRWAVGNGFANTTLACTDPGPMIPVGRIRQTVIERTRQPVAHSAQTLRDTYLMPSSAVRTDSRIVVADALREQVDKARTHQAIPVFTAAFVAAARADPGSAAGSAGLTPGVLDELIAGHHDTVAVACVDHRASPYTPVGVACRASFLTCLDCPNARALPHHLPVQTAVRDRIVALRPHLDPPVFQARFAVALAQLDDILDHYTSAEQARARATVTAGQQLLVDELFEGRLDLR